MNISKAVELIDKVKSHFKNIQTQKGCEKTLVDAKEVAESLEIEPVFPTVSQVRSRKMKRQFDCESRAESIMDPKKTFRSKFLFCVQDLAINSLEEQFSQLITHNNLFEFMSNMKNEKKDILLKKCTDLQLALTHENHCNVEASSKTFGGSYILCNVANVKEGLQCITTNCFCENFPNIFIALRIVLILSVSVASGERNFSKLKLIKNYLRSTVSRTSDGAGYDVNRKSNSSIN